VFAQPSQEIDDLLADLLKRSDVCLLRVATIDAARLALRDVAVNLVIICPETETGSVTAVLDEVDRRRPGTPVLALRSRQGEEVPAWRTRTVGILRYPVLPDVLSRTVDVALGLRVQVRTEGA
jgi:DNA-binding NtrC family response regulator